MSDALDYVRNNCGMAGEEVAEMVEALRKERDELQKHFDAQCESANVLFDKANRYRAMMEQAVEVLSDEKYIPRYSQVEEAIDALHECLEEMK